MPNKTENSRNRINRTNDLRARLTPEQFYVTQQKGTEPAFTGKYWNHHEDGHVPLRGLRGRIVYLGLKV